MQYMTPADLAAFFDATLPRVYAYFARRSDSRATAEDLTQETYVAAAAAIKKGTQVLEPDHWIFGLARHRLIDHFRSLDREQRKLQMAWRAGERADQEMESVELTSDRVHRALASLLAIHRLVLTLRYLDGLSTSEIADQIGRSVHATESLLSRGRDGFRRAYVEDSYDS